MINKLIINSGKSVSPLKDLFGNILKTIDIPPANLEAPRDEINKMIADATEGYIENIVSVNDFNHWTSLIITSTVYLQALWEKPFNSYESKDDIFYGSKNLTVTYMRQINYFNHCKFICN